MAMDVPRRSHTPHLHCPWTHRFNAPHGIRRPPCRWRIGGAVPGTGGGAAAGGEGRGGGGAGGEEGQELEEIRAMTMKQLEEEVLDLKGELFLLRLKRSARQEFKSSEFGRMCKRIARKLTVKIEREIEQGINKRLSRKLDRKWKQSIVVRPPPCLREKNRKQQKETI